MIPKTKERIAKLEGAIKPPEPNKNYEAFISLKENDRIEAKYYLNGKPIPERLYKPEGPPEIIVNWD